MPAIPFPLSSSPGAKPQEGGGRLINAYPEKTGEGARFPVLWKRTPGLRERLSIADHVHLRGAILVASTLICVLDTRAYAVTVSGTTYTGTNLGALAGTDRVTIAKNNNATPQIVCVSDQGCSNLFTGSAPTNFADGDLPAANSVCSMDGYFVWSHGSGRLTASELNSVSVATNSFTTEQGLAGRRVVAYRGELFYFGDQWCGVYRNAATSPFPFERRFTIARGIAGTHAIAGWEPGWANELIWVGEDLRVYRLNGYTPEPISTPDVERSLKSASDPTLLEATVYMNGGTPVWQITSPGEFTWEYIAGNWIERESYGRDDCRMSNAVKAFDVWLAGDRTTGKISEVDATWYREINEPLVWTLESGVVSQFPARMTAPRADFDFTAAVGQAAGEDPIQTDPTVRISFSNDGGYSYGNPLERKLGQQGKSNQVVASLRTGLIKARGRRFRLVVSDPVHVGFMGGQMVAQQGAA
jgi:hypothetical protein